MELEPEAVGRRLQVSCGCLGKRGIGRVDEECHDGRGGKKLMQQFQPFRRNHRVQLGHARDVAELSRNLGDDV